MITGRPRPTRDQRTAQRRRHDQPRSRSWPFPDDRPVDRARTLANALLEQLAEAAPGAAAEFRSRAHHLGETWIGAAPDATAGDWLTRDEVAALAAVDPKTVSAWTHRGTRAGHLTRHPQGYHEREVVDFLAALRAAPEPQEET